VKKLIAAFRAIGLGYLQNRAGDPAELASLDPRHELRLVLRSGA
jgi:hypothetical protein